MADLCRRPVASLHFPAPSARTHPNVHLRSSTPRGEAFSSFSPGSLLRVHLTPFTSQTAAVSRSHTSTHAPVLIYFSRANRRAQLCALALGLSDSIS